MTRGFLVLSLFLLANAAAAVGPRVDIVIGEKATSLEKQAAQDIAADLKQIYDADVRIETAAPEGAANVIFLGSLETNEETKKLIAENWPKLSAVGHVIKTIQHRGKRVLFIGGGSQRAAYWAAAEYSHELGVRTMLYGNLYPVAPKPFTTDGFDTVIDSETPKHAGWGEEDPFPTGYTSWGIADHKRLLRQLSRMKFDTLYFELRSWQPFVHFEIDGIGKRTGVLWYGWKFPVSGDTAGRSAFQGAKHFENANIPSNLSYDERIQAGKKLLSEIIDEAHSRGMTIDLCTSPMELPKEFAPILTGSEKVIEPVELTLRSTEKRVRDSVLTRYETAQMNAYRTAYPSVESFSASSEMPLRPVRTNFLVCDINFNAYHRGRQVFGKSLTLEEACRDLVTPVCGEGVDSSVAKALRQIDDATTFTLKNDRFFNMPGSDMILKHYASSDPPPEWWSKVRGSYLGAMNDMYRANSRAREGGRSYTLYLARRCEFGYEYMNCVEATRKSGIAKSKKDTAEQRAQLEKAIESMNAACSALAAVARDQSDRGMIAVCNEFGYKALQKELEKLDGEEGK